ncbi:UL16-binding protein 6-like [Meriones unguiculatus]|uniref:UL16-binding protein 6-like n=1 Tax=Meriones unguiculatus TaxID=10047 RepID=UPI00293F7828|nr:UL16-binding protein 6-like [Meriones unguiculatus]
MGTEPLTLQAKICCWNEGDGGFSRSWDLSLNGPKTFHIDSNTKKGPEMDSRCNCTKEMAVKIHEVIGLLNRTSQGECRSWVRETKLHCEENLEHTGSTSKAPNITQVIPATPPPPTTPIQNTTNTKILGSLGAVVALLAIGIGVRAKIHKKRFYQDVRSHMGSHLVLGASPCCRSDHESNGNSVSTAASWTSLEQYPSLLPHSQKRKPSDGVGDL